MDIISVKKDLRNKMLAIRNELPSKEKRNYDTWICDQLQKLVTNSNFKTVHVYLPMGNEINIIPFIQYLLAEKITVIAPKTLPRPKLENRILTDLTALEKGVFGTVHPSNPEVYEGPIDLIVIPGLAIDSNHNRLGYGGAYYDNFLCHHEDAFKLGIYYPFQEIEKVPTESHDAKLDEYLILSGFEFSNE